MFPRVPILWFRRSLILYSQLRKLFRHFFFGLQTRPANGMIFYNTLLVTHTDSWSYLSSIRIGTVICPIGSSSRLDLPHFTFAFYWLTPVLPASFFHFRSSTSKTSVSSPSSFLYTAMLDFDRNHEESNSTTHPDGHRAEYVTLNFQRFSLETN